jgi:hypothetical protein
LGASHNWGFGALFLRLVCGIGTKERGRLGIRKGGAQRADLLSLRATGSAAQFSSFGLLIATHYAAESRTLLKLAHGVLEASAGYIHSFRSGSK